MLGLQNILQKKKNLLQSDVVQHDWEGDESKFWEIQSCCATSLSKSFFFFFLISLAFLFLVSIQSIGWQYMSQGKNIYK
jgi:hypothetical protein